MRLNSRLAAWLNPMVDGGQARHEDPRPRHLETRRHARVPLDISVTLESDDNFYAGFTGDISEGGLFIATDTPPPMGAVVAFRLHLPGEPHGWDVKGVVRWVREDEACGPGVRPGCGVQFTEIPMEAVVEIADFVQRRETIFFDA